jgi:hypothetical protein
MDSAAAVPPGSVLTILTADSIEGSFANADNQVVTDTGARFEIQVTPTAVRLIAR